MRYLFRNLHIFLFAGFSIVAAVWVAERPEQTARMIRPLVEDAVELQDLGQAVYNEIDRISWQQSVDEAVSLYVATLRMPTNLFERLSERLEEVERKLSKSQIAKRRQSDPVSAWRTISSSFR